ncbi:MAG: VWA domain-containing protein [Hydrogenophaga sp.]|uniref:VWA domain-containing protein n=1 Tax=Hydrogenophaga sp. TaxID=1904254 RepID=UPI0027356567|nr:VWA domain-containing protein [Hydrogenophaga sp.]MDP3344225.1 VWA domain-containing protein [Hydrogenophaga sp.]MDP3807417.1 VWA domain-containing protein [Hydrogenophaga sp.]MDP3925016.1 VWA domain-containing protein [Hydrogenophaga sp.]
MNTQASAPSKSLAGFAAMLRDHGLKVGVSEQQAMLQAALALGPLQGQRLCAAWRAMACHSARDWRQWPELFERYWYPQRLKGQVRVSGQMRPSRDLRQAVQELHKNMEAPAASAPGKAAPHTASELPGAHANTEDAGSPRAMGGASRHEVQVEALHQRDGQMWLPQELGALQQLAKYITARLRPRPTRRWHTAQPGRRLDLRQTLRRSVAWGGEPLRPAWMVQRREPPRLFILADVSRSMESHAPLFLRVARAFAVAAQARVFVFHTRLAEITPLMQRDSSAIQEKINAVTAGFGAGTRIASSLHDFVRVHAKAQLNRGARVWIFSDGFDTDAPDALPAALQAVRARGARITWFHPTRAVPAAAALQRSRACIERFYPLASLNDLAAASRSLN